MTLAMRDQEKYEEGRQDNRVETAKKMLADGLDHKFVAKYSGLSLEDVEALAQPDPA